MSKYTHLVNETRAVSLKSDGQICHFTDLKTLNTLKTSIQLWKQITEFKQNLVSVLSLFDRQKRLDCLSYMRLYHTKMHICSLLQGTAEYEKKQLFFEDGDLEMGEIQYLVIPHYLQHFPVLTNVTVYEETKSKHIQEALSKQSSQISGLEEDVNKKMLRPESELEDISALTDRLQDLKAVSQDQDEGLRKNSTGWKLKADSLILEMSPLVINNDMMNIIGEDAILASAEDISHNSSISQASVPPVTCRSSQVYLLIEFQHGRLQKRNFRNLLQKAIIEDSCLLSDLVVKTGRLERVFGPVYIFSKAEQSLCFSVSCPPMTLNRKRVHSTLTVSREDGQFLTNRESSGTDHSPDQFKKCRGTCSGLIPLPSSPSTPTVIQYWETYSRVQVKQKGSEWHILEMAVTEQEDLDRDIWVSLGGSGWSVEVIDCNKHRGLCTQVWEKGSLVGDCISTTPSCTPNKDIEFRLGVAIDVRRGRLSFIDVNRGKVLHKFHDHFHQSLYPVVGVWPSSKTYLINMQLVSGGEISITDSKKALITEALCV